MGFSKEAVGSQKGITLLEVLVVVLVIAIMGAFAKPPMTRYLRTLEQKNAVVGIRKLVQTARSRAMANPSVHCGVYFDMASKPPKVQLFHDTFAPGSYAYDAGRDTPYQQAFTLPKGTTLSIPDPYPASIIYRGDGSAYLSSKVLVRSAAFVDTVDVLASTGRVRTTR